MIEGTHKIFAVLAEIPHDIYATLLIALGTGLALLGHHDESMLVLGAGLGVFKGSK